MGQEILPLLSEAIFLPAVKLTKYKRLISGRSPSRVMLPDFAFIFQQFFLFSFIFLWLRFICCFQTIPMFQIHQ